MSQTFFCPFCGAIQSHAVFATGPVVPCPACGKELNEFAIDGPLVSGPGSDEDDDNRITFGRRTEEAEMDMTPMVDIVFQLLIFFMVTASFALQRAMEIPKPEENRPSTSGSQQPKDIESDSDYVIVRVDSLGSFHVMAVDWDQEEEAPSQQELIIKLKRARVVDKDGKVPHKMLVKAHGEAAHGRVVLALDAGPIVGLREVQLQTVEEDD